jgi:hypothetical protein
MYYAHVVIILDFILLCKREDEESQRMTRMVFHSKSFLLSFHTAACSIVMRHCTLRDSGVRLYAPPNCPTASLMRNDERIPRFLFPHSPYATGRALRLINQPRIIRSRRLLFALHRAALLNLHPAGAIVGRVSLGDMVHYAIPVSSTPRRLVELTSLRGAVCC